VQEVVFFGQHLVLSAEEVGASLLALDIVDAGDAAAETGCALRAETVALGRIW